MRGLLYVVTLLSFAGPASGLEIDSLETDGSSLSIGFASSASSYYVLIQGEDVTAIETPVALALGEASGDGLFVESFDSDAGFYRIKEVPVNDPDDSDDDGIDDLYELNFAFLDPFIKGDAALDFDSDGVSNLDEFLNGTDPSQPDVSDLSLVLSAPVPNSILPLGNDVSLIAEATTGAGDIDRVEFYIGNELVEAFTEPPFESNWRPSAPGSYGVFAVAYDYFGASVFSDLVNVAIQSPLPELIPSATNTSGDFITLSGTGLPGASLVVVGGAADVATIVPNDGNVEIQVPLMHNRLNRIFVCQETEGGTVSPQLSFEILQDSEKPSVHIDFPEDGSVITTDTLVVAGRVGDMLSGFEGLEVLVNGEQANVVVGIGQNGTFERSGVPLVSGINTISVTARDIHGHEASASIQIQKAVATGPRMAAISGDLQAGMVYSTLEEPVVVRVTKPDGSPFPNKVVTFDVLRSDGRLMSDPDELEGSLILQATTDANGFARAWWRMGTDAGSGNNRLAVTSKDISGSVFFCASAQPEPPGQINIGSGNNQRAEAGGPAFEPLRAWVSDSCNGIEGVPVTFRVLEGGGLVNGQSQITVMTTRTGHAQVDFLLGPKEGSQVVEADFEGNPTGPAVFNLYGVGRKMGQPTTYSGLVLDNASQPLGNVECVLDLGDEFFFSSTDESGSFRFDNVPGGPGYLHVFALEQEIEVNGEIAPVGSYPDLSFEILVVPNARNEHPAPVLLPRLDPDNARNYDGTEDVVLTVKGMEGLKMFVKAGSMTLRDGSKPSVADPAVITLNQVHHDDVPMPMPDGASPPFAWTLQPAGATFDPPIQIEYPNMSGLPAGAIAYFLSYNHDTEDFEIVASSHVTDDASKIVTDKGVGLTIAGWGCNCPPYSVTGVCERPICPPASGSGAGAAAAMEGCDPGPDPDADDGDGGADDGPSDVQNGDGEEQGGGAPDADTPEPDNGGDGAAGDGDGTTPDVPGGDDDSTGADTSGDPVISFTGELVVEETDLQIPGRGFPFKLTRVYRSKYNYNGILGHNWDFSYNRRLLLPALDSQDQDVLLCSGFARVDRYRFDEAGNRYVSPRRLYNQLTMNEDGSFSLRERDGFRTNFDSTGVMVSQVDRNGNTMEFNYNNLGQLEEVIDTLGRSIRFSYYDEGRLHRVTDFSGRSIVYAYDDRGDLRAVASPIVSGTSTGNDFPDGKIVRYDYSFGFDEQADPRNRFLNHNLIGITDPKGQRYLVNTYGTNPESYNFDRVIRQRSGSENQFFTFLYEEMNPGSGSDAPDVPRNRTTVIDRNGNRRITTHNAFGRALVERVQTNRGVNPDDPDDFVTEHTYNGDGELASTSYPEGNSIVYDYDDENPDRLQQGNLLSVIHLPGPRGGGQTQRKVSYTYEPVFNRVRSMTDERGNDPSFEPPNGGQGSPARYTTFNTFDYQEGSDLSGLAEETELTVQELQARLDLAGVSVGLGDINGDGLVGQNSGNLIRRENPDVLLLPDSRQAQIEGDENQEITTIWTYNEFGQKTSEMDSAGNVDEYVYHPENDPDGDGIVSLSDRGLSSDEGGYLFAVVRDTRTTPGRLSERDPTMIRTERYYDPVGNVIRAVDGQGQDTLYEVNALNQVIVRSSEEVLAGDGSLVRYRHRYHYDENNNVVLEEVENIDTNGPDLGQWVLTSYEYDILDNLTAVDRQVSLSKTLRTSYRYDRNENRIAVIQPEGNAIQTVFDERDLVYSVTRGAGSADASVTTRTYDGNGNLIRAVDGEDNNGDGVPEATTRTYDGYDRLISITDAVGNRAEFAYDPAGNRVLDRRSGLNRGPSPTGDSGAGNSVLSEVRMLHDELGREYQRDHSLFANETTVGPEGPLTPDDGKVTSRFEYDPNGRLVRSVDDNIHHTLRAYDGADRLVREVDQLENEVQFVYDGNSNVLTVTEIEKSPEGLVPDETFVTIFEYDPLDRLVADIDNMGNVREFRHDSRDNVTQTIDQMENTTTFIHDGINRKLADIADLRQGGTGSGDLDLSNPANPDGQITKQYVWDDNSRLASLVDDNGNPTSYAYDELNRLTVETFADTTTTVRGYDRDDNVVRYTDNNGSVQINAHDGINRLIRKTVERAPGVEGTTEWRFEYDGLSRLTMAFDNNDPLNLVDDATCEFVYDSLGRVLIEKQGIHSIASVWDGVGNRTSLTYPNGRVIQSAFDALDRTKQIRNLNGAGFVAEYDYVGPTRVLERRHGNGTRMTFHDGAGNDIGYDALRRRIGIYHRDADEALIAGFEHAFDREDNRRFERDLFRGVADVYEYDSTYRLTRVVPGVDPAQVAEIANNATDNSDVPDVSATAETTYQLDGVGNWSTRNDQGTGEIFTANEMNEYATVDGVAQSHDDNGNLAEDGERKYFHDFANRLVRIIDAADDSVAIYTYDAPGRRASKTVGEVITEFLYDGHHVIEEHEDGDVARHFVFGPRIDEALELMDIGGGQYFYHQNYLGSTVALSDDSGSVLERYAYSEYGETKLVSGAGLYAIALSSVGNPFQYTGRRFDAESGLYFYRARYYDAEHGRFLQRDPKGYIDGMGIYQYVGSDPVNYTDPTGHEKGDPDYDWMDDIFEGPPDFDPATEDDVFDTQDQEDAARDWEERQRQREDGPSIGERVRDWWEDKTSHNSSTPSSLNAIEPAPGEDSVTSVSSSTYSLKKKPTYQGDDYEKRREKDRKRAECLRTARNNFQKWWCRVRY